MRGESGADSVRSAGGAVGLASRAHSVVLEEASGASDASGGAGRTAGQALRNIAALSASSVAVDVEVVIAIGASGGRSTGRAGSAVVRAILGARSAAKSVEGVAGGASGGAVGGAAVAVGDIADEASSVAHRSWIEWRLARGAGVVGVAGGAR